MSKRIRRAGLSAVLITLALPAAVLGLSSSASAYTGPGAAAAAVTCAGQGVEATAKIRYRTEILIQAPLRTIWKLQTDVEKWTEWQSAPATVERLDAGRLRAGSRFRWTTPVQQTPTTPATTLVITSTVRQLQPQRCIRWTGPAIGEGLTIDRGTHVWTYRPTHRGVLVSTEETWSGAQVEADVPTSTAYLRAGLESWLTELKTAAEVDTCRR